MTKVKFKDLKKAYETAVKNNEESFKIQDLEFLTTYAKYVIEYLGMRKIDKEEYIDFVKK